MIDVLQNAVDEGGFTKMAVCREDGVSLSNDGSVLDVSHRDYFQKAMGGTPDVSEPLTLSAIGQQFAVSRVSVFEHQRVLATLQRRTPWGRFTHKGGGA